MPKIVFMGTAEFAIPSLEILIQNGYPIPAVITAPDKPAGRGQKIKFSPVKDHAIKSNLTVLQPENLKEESFIGQLKGMNPDIFVVVAFRMLPKAVWEIPLLGTFNLHASLLPQYRGAAPINWAIINGEKETGVTTFFIDDQIDTGKIIESKRIEINSDDNAGSLHDKLMMIGAELVLETVNKISNGQFELKDQDQLIQSGMELKKAPKIFRDDCKISWDEPVEKIHNLVRGLNPYPGSFTQIASPEGRLYDLKVFETFVVEDNQIPNHSFPQLKTDGKTYLQVICRNGIIGISKLQQEGKRRMNTEEFLRGFSISENWKIIG